jgi:hypothetical protein
MSSTPNGRDVKSLIIVPPQDDPAILASQDVEEEDPRLNSDLTVQQDQSRRPNRVDSCWNAQLRLLAHQERPTKVLAETLEELSEKSMLTITRRLS